MFREIENILLILFIIADFLLLFLIIRNQIRKNTQSPIRPPHINGNRIDGEGLKLQDVIQTKEQADDFMKRLKDLEEEE